MPQSNPTRKYFTENAVSLFTSTVILLPPDQLHAGSRISPDVAAELARCHIYLICRRPVLSYAQEHFRFSQQTASGRLVRKIEGNSCSVEFQFPLVAPEGGRVEVGPYPHRELIGFDAGGQRVCRWPASFVSLRAKISDPSIRDFEVIYVGQAYGDGKRSAFDRLRSHATLQRILGESASRRPDDEIMLFLFEYEPYRIMAHMDPTVGVQIAGDADMVHFAKLVDNPISERQQISIAEAGLIRYFDPEYNQVYRDSFPHDELRILKQCYDLDFAALTIEINTEEVHAPIWSKVAGKGLHHIANFDLHDASTRRSFFAELGNDGRATVAAGSGPIF